VSTLWEMIGRVLPWVTGGGDRTGLPGVQIDDRVKLRPGVMELPPARRAKPARRPRHAAGQSNQQLTQATRDQPSLFGGSLFDETIEPHGIAAQAGPQLDTSSQRHADATKTRVAPRITPPPSAEPSPALATGAIIIRPPALLVPAKPLPNDLSPAIQHPTALPTTRPRRLPTRGDEAEARYDEVVRLMLDRYNVRIRRWRKNMSGVAWILEYRDGTTKRWLESPKPKTPLSLSIFLHEIGHHAIGFRVYKPRCLEEYHAWAFALEAMREQGIEVTEPVRRRMHKSLKYAVDKAMRRGLKALPPELEPFKHEYVG
jgi:hypothetical protein